MGTQIGTATAAEVIVEDAISGGGTSKNDGGSDVRGLRRVLPVRDRQPLDVVEDGEAGGEAERTRLEVDGRIRVGCSMGRQQPVHPPRKTCCTAEAV